MKSLVVIMPFDIFKNREANLLNTFEGAAMVQAFSFQIPPEAFTRSVVSAFALAAYVLGDSKPF